jgi:hypothetical protein
MEHRIWRVLRNPWNHTTTRIILAAYMRYGPRLHVLKLTQHRYLKPGARSPSSYSIAASRRVFPHPTARTPSRMCDYVLYMGIMIGTATDPIPMNMNTNHLRIHMNE